MKHLLGSIFTIGALTSAAEGQQRSQPSVAPQTMQRWAPALADYTDRVLFGDVWRRTELSPRDRSLVTISVLIATGKTAQLGGHLGRALDNGVLPSEVAGLVTHLAFYTGWPSAVSALEVIDKVMRERNVDPASIRSNAALLPAPVADSASATSLPNGIDKSAPKFVELSKDVLADDLWRRPDLAPRDRSLVTIATLAATGEAGQLPQHFQRAAGNGLTDAQMAEALTHLGFYAGWPKAGAAISKLAETRSTSADVALSPAEPPTIVPPGISPVRGSASRFAGSVQVASAFEGTDGSRIGGATVTFQPAARTNWHRHPLGQLLVVTQGEGRIQNRGSSVRTIRAGDVVWTAPGVEHWHGAGPTTAMTHVAVSEAVDGRVVDWGEGVPDEVYRAPATR